MNTTSKNDFTKPEVREKSRYKMWVKYHLQYTTKSLPETKVYYSYEKPGNENYGYNRLVALVTSNRYKIKRAILYDNLTGREIERY